MLTFIDKTTWEPGNDEAVIASAVLRQGLFHLFRVFEVINEQVFQFH